MQQSLNKIQGQTIAVYLNWILSKKYRQRIHGKINSMFRTPEHRLIFSTSHALENQCEFSRVKLYRNDLKGNKNYFELAGGLSYRWYLSLICVLSSCELPRVKLQQMYEGNPEKIDFGSSQREGSRYPESSVYRKQKDDFKFSHSN